MTRSILTERERRNEHHFRYGDRPRQMLNISVFEQLKLASQSLSAGLCIVTPAAVDAAQTKRVYPVPRSQTIKEGCDTQVYVAQQGALNCLYAFDLRPFVSFWQSFNAVCVAYPAPTSMMLRGELDKYLEFKSKSNIFDVTPSDYLLFRMCLDLVFEDALLKFDNHFSFSNTELRLKKGVESSTEIKLYHDIDAAYTCAQAVFKHLFDVALPVIDAGNPMCKKLRVADLSTDDKLLADVLDLLIVWMRHLGYGLSECTLNWS